MKLVLFVVCSLLFAVGMKAQTAPGKTLKIAVFAPVYLDSAFADDTYKLGRSNLPRYILPGLDFYNGVMLAIDSLNTEKAPVEILFYDSKSSTTPLSEIVAGTDLQDISLIIASFTNRNEIKSLADFSLAKKIPLISATYPNDGDITGNPFFVLLNPTLSTHIEGVYKYIHRVFPMDNIILFRKKGNVENMIQSVLLDMNKKTPGIPLKIKTVELPDSFTTKEVTDYLDSSRQNIVVCGSLNEDFGMALSKAISSSKSYRAIAVGMPTWDGLRDISNNLEIVYSTPYNLSRTDKLSIRLSEKYRTKYAGRPSDMVFKGFESMYHFTKLLLKYGNTLIDHLSAKEFKLFNDFDIQPVKIDKTAITPDYLENKKLYFIRKMDGNTRSVN
jgi:hypothetical protein